jgi:hypothetical protein
VLGRSLVLTLLFASASLLAFAGGCAPAGQRLLKAEIELDGKVILATSFGVPDGWDPASAWRRLRKVGFEATDPAATASLASAPQLKGRVRIALRHAGAAFAVVAVGELRLEVDASAPHRWRIAPHEVERTGRSL